MKEGDDSNTPKSVSSDIHTGRSPLMNAWLAEYGKCDIHSLSPCNKECIHLCADVRAASRGTVWPTRGPSSQPVSPRHHHHSREAESAVHCSATVDPTLLQVLVHSATLNHAREALFRDLVLGLSRCCLCTSHDTTHCACIKVHEIP